jgi:hypothetical protein
MDFVVISRIVVVHTRLIADDDVRCKCHGLSFVSCELCITAGHYASLLIFGKLFWAPIFSTRCDN